MVRLCFKMRQNDNACLREKKSSLKFNNYNIFCLFTDDVCFHNTNVTDGSNAGLMLSQPRAGKINSNLEPVTQCT